MFGKKRGLPRKANYHYGSSIYQQATGQRAAEPPKKIQKTTLKSLKESGSDLENLRSQLIGMHMVLIG
jgi:hypothetical protein